MAVNKEMMDSDEYRAVCRRAIYSEEYLDYLDFEGYEEYADPNIICTQMASGRFVVLYEPGRYYHAQRPVSGAKFIPRCYGLLASDQILSSSGVAKVQRQPGLSLYGQGVLVGFVDTGDCVILLPMFFCTRKTCSNWLSVMVLCLAQVHFFNVIYAFLAGRLVRLR